jgi:hypothetical protein
LLDLQYKIEYKKGIDNKVNDVLSRCDVQSRDLLNIFTELIFFLRLYHSGYLIFNVIIRMMIGLRHTKRSSRIKALTKLTSPASRHTSLQRHDMYKICRKLAPSTLKRGSRLYLGRSLRHQCHLSYNLSYFLLAQNEVCDSSVCTILCHLSNDQT